MEFNSGALLLVLVLAAAAAVFLVHRGRAGSSSGGVK
jgi:hypothetical protein